MIYSESTLTPQQLEILIGKPIEINSLSLKAIGSPPFYLKEFLNKNTNSNDLILNSRCSFQKFERGLVLRSSVNTKVMVSPIPYQDFLELELTGGIERINPLRFSPFWFLLKFGLKIRYARYFAFGPKEYNISELILEIETEKYALKMVTNGYLKTEVFSFFETN